MKKILLLIFLGLGFQSCFILKSVSVSEDVAFLAGAGKAGITGGESWEDPLGIQLSVESRILELGDKASINSGIGVSFQGADWKEGSLSGTVNLSYLNFPLLFNYQDESGFFGEIGLQPGFLLSAKDEYNGMSEDFKDHVKGFELGLPVGAGYHINNSVGVGVRATFGLTNLDDTGSDVKDHNYLVVGMIRIKPNWFEK